MSGNKSGLARYPLLAQWYAASAALPSSLPADRLFNVKKQFCRALCYQGSEGYEQWARAYAGLCGGPAHAGQAYQELEHFFGSHGLLFNQLALDMASFALETPYSLTCSQLLDRAAAMTGLPAVFFLAAWMALNRQELEHCVSLCSAVTTPHAPLYTLHGQALLELGRPEQAIPLLEVATELEASDPLPWVQLAKAEMVQGLHEEAWQTLQVCLTLSPSHPELALFSALIALAEPSKQDWQRAAWTLLAPHLASPSLHEGIVVPLLKLSFSSGQREWAQQVVHASNWHILGRRLLANGELGFVLRELGAQSWYDLAQHILMAMEVRQEEADK